jgi:hypothetical protein
MKTGSFATDPERPSRRGEPTRAGETRIVAHSISDVPTLRYRGRRPAIDVSHAKFIEIDGKRVLWGDMLEKRREQLALVAAKRLGPSRRAPTSMEAISEGQLHLRLPSETLADFSGAHEAPVLSAADLPRFCPSAR